MSEIALFAAAEKLVSSKLGIDNAARSGCEPCFLYNGSRVEVIPAEYVDDLEPPYFNIRRAASACSSGVCVFALKKSLEWDFYVTSASVINSCFGGQSVASLPMITPMSIRVDVGRIKQAVDLAVGAA